MPYGWHSVDSNRGIWVEGSKVVLNTSYTKLHVVQVGEPGTGKGETNPLVTFELKYGTKYVEVSTTGAKLGTSPQLFGAYPGYGFGGPRYIFEATKTGGFVKGDLGLTASGTVLKVAYANPNATSPNRYQCWELEGA
ncbi:MAG: hypothetical protein ABR922_17000 [Streptosporangiaceae bacterium]